MNYKVVLCLLLLIFKNSIFAKFYKCPDITPNTYHSIFSEIDEWQIYAVSATNKTIHKFITKETINDWTDYNIEITFNKDMSILFCSSVPKNIQASKGNTSVIVWGEIRALKFIDEVNCSIDSKNKGFMCY
ncbi:hypothetical protein QEJ31_14885 [Pigmentibacter sp. JX0631]|uniref:hypothetical protein n=1 Tax=Pigmentibacter sp. JX0631 TaxID=2976982 RepID=UPI002469113C|nr:hypothetical protein [Pigmentibacter sp. JX0631]WGL59814.1 hypothetical protein QEJ31_14885 [Pigmentibacter sp. JX0631]